MKTYIAVDIGKNGSIAVVKDKLIETHPMPKIKTELDIPGFYDLIQHLVDREITAGTTVHFSFEKLGVIFGSGKNVAFSMGLQAGMVETVAVALGVPYTKITAKDWQKNIFQGVEEILIQKAEGKPKRDTKAMALVAIKRLYPQLKLTFGERAQKPHDGLIDAVLIATYAKRLNL